MGYIDGGSPAPFALPRITLEEELSGGHQGHVWRGRRGDQELVLKAVDARHHTRDDVSRRVQLVRRLCRVTPLPCAPVRMGQEWVVEVGLSHGGQGFATAHELLDGAEPSLTDPSDVAAMGRALAELHRELARLSSPRLGRFTATEPPDSAVLAGAGLPVPPGLVERHRERMRTAPRQLVHGDFGPHNLRRTGSGSLRVFDFDEAGHAAALAELSNTLYLALFALAVEGEGAHDAYPTFREQFLDAYGAIDEAAVDDGVVVRVLVLGQWLALPDTAPPGVAASSPEWKRQLEGFVREQLSRTEGSSGW